MKLKCTKDNPYKEERDKFGMKWEHDNVIEVGEQKDGWPSGDIVTMKCLNCGMIWEEELPQ